MTLTSPAITCLWMASTDRCTSFPYILRAHVYTHTQVYVFVLAKACAPISCCLYLLFLIWGGWWTTGYQTSAKKVYNGSLSWGGRHIRTYLQVWHFEATYKMMNPILDLQPFSHFNHVLFCFRCSALTAKTRWTESIRNFCTDILFLSMYT